MSATSTLQVWNCPKCSTIRSAKCGSVCLPGDVITRESTQTLGQHPAAHHAWVSYAVLCGADRDIAEDLTTAQLIELYGGGQ